MLAEKDIFNTKQDLDLWCTVWEGDLTLRSHDACLHARPFVGLWPCPIRVQHDTSLDGECRHGNKLVVNTGKI